MHAIDYSTPKHLQSCPIPFRIIILFKFATNETNLITADALPGHGAVIICADTGSVPGEEGIVMKFEHSSSAPVDMTVS